MVIQRSIISWFRDVFVHLCFIALNMERKKPIWSILFRILSRNNNVFTWNMNVYTFQIFLSIMKRWRMRNNTMMTSSNENVFRVTDLLCGEFTGLRWIPDTKAGWTELWCFFYLPLKKRLSKQSLCWWFETPSGPLWRHCSETRFLESYSRVGYTLST